MILTTMLYSQLMAQYYLTTDKSLKQFVQRILIVLYKNKRFLFIEKKAG